MLFEEIAVEEFAEIRAREAYEMGEESGFTKGEQSGIKRGAAQEKREIAKKLKALGMTVEQISQATGLDAADVESIGSVN